MFCNNVPFTNCPDPQNHGCTMLGAPEPVKSEMGAELVVRALLALLKLVCPLYKYNVYFKFHFKGKMYFIYDISTVLTT